MEAVIGKILGDLGTFLFGPIMLAVFFGVGLYFTVRLKGVQFTRFKTAFREVVLNVGKKSDDGVGEIRSYKALATALSSCVGNGNVVGVAYAIAVGGPGAIFWMWIAALGGMATKFAEIALAMHFRVQDEDGNFRGGVMYILTRGMKQKTVARILGGAFAVSVTGDDSLAENSLARLAERMAERPGADIYACAIREYRDGGGTIRTIDNFLPDAPTELTGHDAVLLLYHHWRYPSPMVQENLWRRGFLNERHLRFVPGLQHDDHEFFPRALYLAQRIVPLHEEFYLYRRQSASITMAAPRRPGHFNRHMAVVLKSLFAFHAAESARPGFDPRIAKCWAREWIGWIIWFWFFDAAPRALRQETLQALFVNGFDDFDLLVRSASFFKRVAAWWIRLMVRHPSLTWAADCFFQCYFAVAYIKNKCGGPQWHVHGERQE